MTPRYTAIAITPAGPTATVMACGLGTPNFTTVGVTTPRGDTLQSMAHAPWRWPLYVLVGCFAALPAAAADLPQVTVLPFVGSTVPRESRLVLDELLMVELAKRHDLQFMTMHEINLLLGMERLKDI